MPTVQLAPTMMWSDLKVPSSREWLCKVLAAFNVQSLPTVTSVRSTMWQPSSKTRRPIRTPSRRQMRFL